jgi:alkylation response protein AidB-like acyl-CoA dehydrogenase
VDIEPSIGATNRYFQPIYGGTSEIMKTIIAREVTGLRT